MLSCRSGECKPHNCKGWPELSISEDAPQFKPIFPQSFFLNIYIKLKLSSWFISMPYSSPTEPLERDLVLGSEVAGFTVIYFAYESLYLTFLFIKNLTDVVMHF